MAVADLERSLTVLNWWRLIFIAVTAVTGFGILVVQFQYNRKDAQLRHERASEALRERERVASIENDTAKALLLLAWRRLNKEQFRVVEEGLRRLKIERLQIAALAGDPEATQFAADILAAARDAGYKIPHLRKIVSSIPYFGLKISGPREEVASLADLFGRAGFRDVDRQETGPGPVQISVGSKPPPRSN
jgi:hypothetical protein